MSYADNYIWAYLSTEKQNGVGNHRLSTEKPREMRESGRRERILKSFLFSFVLKSQSN